MSKGIKAGDQPISIDVEKENKIPILEQSFFLIKKAVSDKLFSAAICCIIFSSKCWNITAAGLPVKALLLKAST